jgi:hypothetical protein
LLYSSRSGQWISSNGEVIIVNQFNWFTFNKSVDEMNQLLGWTDTQVIEEYFGMLINQSDQWINYPNIGMNRNPEFEAAMIIEFYESFLFRFFTHNNPDWTHQELTTAINKWFDEHSSVSDKIDWLNDQYKVKYMNGITASRS